MKNIKIATKISMISVVILTIGLAILWLAANSRMTSVVKQSILDSLKDSVAMQAEIVREYVGEAETYLVGYAQAPKMASTLQNTGDSAAVAVLQEYTDQYASTARNLENVYAANYNSTVIASHVQGVIGVTLREGDALKQLQDAIAGGMYNTGIMASKATGAQVISMYYPVNDKSGQPAGYVGAAIYVDELRDTLNGLSAKDAEGSSYMLLDAAAGTYIFCPDDEMIGTAIESSDMLNIIEMAKNSGNSDSYYEFTDADTGRKMISSAYYLGERDWVLVNLSDWDMAFAAVHALTLMLAVLCLIVLAVISATIWVSVSMIAKDISSEAKIIQNIGTLDFADRKKLQGYCGRKDEVGMIADATGVLVDATARVILELQDKSAKLQKTAREMNENSEVTFETVKTVETAIREIATGAGGQATETATASESVINIGSKIAETKDKSEQLYGVSERISSSSEEAIRTLQTLSDINEQAKVAVEQINKQTLSTNDSVLKIRDAAQLITSIAEETNLLSLNASIEAARAGEQGSGFAVVAGQIKKLAEQSNESAQYIDSIIDVLLKESSEAVEIMDNVKDIMKQQSDRLNDTESCFREVTQHVELTQSEISNITSNITNMDDERIGVVDIVQNLTSIAEQNAASSQESLASTEMVNGMVQKVSEASKELTELADSIKNSISIFKV